MYVAFYAMFCFCFDCSQYRNVLHVRAKIGNVNKNNRIPDGC